MFKDKNLSAIREHHPELYRSLLSGRTDSSVLRFHVEPARNGDPTLYGLEDNGRKIYFHSRYDPSAEAKKIIASWGCLTRESVIVILGFGLGYIPLAALACLRTDQTLIIVEPSVEILSLALEYLNLSELFTRTNTYFAIGHSFLPQTKERLRGVTFKTFSYIHPPSLRAIPEIALASGYLETVIMPRVKRELDYPKLRSPLPRVLMFEGGFFIEKEVVAALKLLGSPVMSLPVKISGDGSTDFIRQLMTALLDFKPDFVFSINQIGFDVEGRLADLLSYYGIPYVSWFVDNPLPLLQRSSANASACGVCLIWDRSYIPSMKALGFANTEYLPYAADTTIFHPLKEPIVKKYPVSFVGSSMEGIILARLAEIKNNSFLMGVYESLIKRDYPFEHLINVRGLICEEVGGRAIPSEMMASLEAAVVSRLTQKRRIAALCALKDLNPHVFGDDGWKRLLPGSFHLNPPVDYRQELPDVYRFTEINLNISSVQLINSVNQRLFDISACGAFLLTDGRDAAAEFLAPGVSIETFRSEKELVDKAKFYLSQKERREEIEKNACQTILERHTYIHRLRELTKLLNARFGTKT